MPINLILLLCLQAPSPTLDMLQRINDPTSLPRPTCLEIAERFTEDARMFYDREGDYLWLDQEVHRLATVANPRFDECMTGPYNWGCGPDSVFKRFQSVCNQQDEDGDLDVDLQDWAQRQNQLQIINLKHNHGDNPHGG